MKSIEKNQMILQIQTKMQVVKEFYEDTPFNFSNDVQVYVESIKNLNQI